MRIKLLLILIIAITTSLPAQENYSSYNACRCEIRNAERKYSLVRRTYNRDVILIENYGNEESCFKLAENYSTCSSNSIRIFGCKSFNNDGIFEIYHFNRNGNMRRLLVQNNFSNIIDCANRAKVLN